LIAGHDTTSTTVNWGLKRLADNQSAQKTLRSELRKAYTAAAAERRNPTIEEITKSHIPYLDAVLEEIVRTALTTSGVIRNAVVDTTVLGHHIPKGTDIFLMGNGPDFFMAPFEVKEEQRSESARSSKGRKVGAWDRSNMRSFIPERWLTKDEEGKEVFDAMAGPLLTFGLGPRGCYGKRLAYLELRTLIVMIVWNFELQQCPEKLSSYAGLDKMTRQPQQCYVRLAEAAW
jgi:cytochrome P450